MYVFFRTYDFNPADILDWTSADGGMIELPYKTDQFLLDAHLEAFPEVMPFYGDEDDEAAVDEYCKCIDNVWSNCTVTATLALAFLDENPAAAFFVKIISPNGEKLDCIGYSNISAEDAAKLIAEFLRHGAAGLTEQAASEYRNALMLYRLIRTVDGEPIPDDEFSHPMLDLLRAGQTPQEIADGLTVA